MTTPSPTCTINGLSAPQDVAANSTVTIALANAAGANYWSITAISTDETNSAAAINATLSINQTNKTATFTAPPAGSAVRFQSVVGINGLGLDANNQVNAAFTTTFKINVKAANGQRVIAANETSEQSATFGWSSIVNNHLRRTATASVLDFGADPTGSVDSSGAFQAALTALSGTGVSLLVPAGSFNGTTVPTTPNPIVPIILGQGAAFAGTWAASMLAFCQANAAPAPPAKTTLKVMCCGDSITAGGNSLMDDTTLAWRGPFWRRLRKARGKIQLLGNSIGGLYDNRLAAPTANPPGDVDLGDWHMSATGGNTLAQILAQMQASVTAQGAPDGFVLLGGEDDIQAGIAGSQTSAQIAATVTAGITTFVNAALGHNPNALIFISDLTTHGVGLATYVASNAAQTLINSQLPALVAGYGRPNVRLVNAGSLLTQSHLDTTGQHPNGEGYAVLGNALADAVLSVIGVCGSPFPRAICQRVPANRVTLTSAQDAYVADTGTIVPTGTASFSFGLMFNPGPTLPASQQTIIQAGPDVVFTGNPDTSGCWLVAGPAKAGAVNGGACLQLYLGGVARYVANDALRINTWHWIAVSVNNAQGEASIYCVRFGANGMPVTTCLSTVRVTAPIYTAPTPARFGADHAVLATAPGTRGEMWFANGTVVTVDDIEDWAIDGRLPEGVTALYPLNEGTGTTLNPAPATSGLIANGVTSGSWSAAGAIREPTHRYAYSAQTQPGPGGTYPLATTGGTSTIADSQTASESGLSWGNAQILYVTGTLASNATVNIPATPRGIFQVSNQTSGAFTLTIQPFGGSGTTVTQGKTGTFFVSPAGALIRTVADT